MTAKSARHSQIARIHIAKKALGLDDDSYSAILARVTGKASSGDMTERERLAVIEEMKRLGWKEPVNQGRFRQSSNKPYVRKMFAIAKSLETSGYWRQPYKQALRSLVKKLTDRDDPEWLSYQEAAPVIEALKQMERRAAQ
ncbi:putative phage regluatory protein [Roseibium sp. TrichSKD4]|uniref:regulatory protein GemA n=1 Tax=Roseibium sp. TrichSKD4 TaxID=744980 RepID=UPI0001E56939|nr:regulatory protein GemA [Roseibium sp. TrichSKD4]EFO32473.1 putative phage regluatory protein [Roseibium sp. TrichSKD4]